MNQDNSQRRSRSLHEYIELYCDGSLSAGQTAEFEQLLRDDPRAMGEFVLYMEIHSRIAWDIRAQETECQERNIASTVDLSASENDLPSLSESEASDSPFIVLSPVAVPASTPFVGGPVFSYMVATVVLCVMLLLAWAYKVTHIKEMVQDDGKPSIRLANDPEYKVVGYVAGMKNCVWAKDSLTTMVGASVPMGRKYELISGLMEINYTSGARIILEGPCDYTADSRAGGYLGRGKLTARIEKRGGRRERGGENEVASASTDLN